MGTPTGTLTLTAANTIFPGAIILGACDLPPPPATQDTFGFVGAIGGNLNTATATLDGSATAFPTGGVMTASTAFAPIVGRYAYKSSSNTSYISEHNGSAWTVQQWVGAGGATVMGGVTHRIDGILSTGELVSTEGDVLRLYDTAGSGTELYAIPLNGLQYCYEAYVGTTPYVFFSLSLGLSRGWWAFTVYAVPTASMRDLNG
jgi:hypothetical protein